jgi:hypothetical protein
MTRALIASVLSAALLAGCGSTNSQTGVQSVPQTVVQKVSESPSPALACIARHAPTGATKESSGVLTVEWPDGELLRVRATASSAEAKAVVGKIHAEQATRPTGVIARSYGTTAVEWSPKAPTAEEAAVLHGCVR